MYDFIKELPAEVLMEDVIAGGRISYRLLKSESFCDGKPRDVYGIEVVSSLFDGRESALIMDISTDYECVKKLYNLAVENLVMPCTLKDITEDYLETVSLT